MAAVYSISKGITAYEMMISMEFFAQLTAFVNLLGNLLPNAFVFLLATIFRQCFIVQTPLIFNYLHEMYIEILIVTHFIHLCQQFTDLLLHSSKCSVFLQFQFYWTKLGSFY